MQAVGLSVSVRAVRTSLRLGVLRCVFPDDGSRA
jgi:hypothetical protein